MRGLLVFLSHYVVKRGPVALQASTDTVQPGIFLVILQQACMHSSFHVCSCKSSALTYPLRRAFLIMSIIWLSCKSELPVHILVCEERYPRYGHTPMSALRRLLLGLLLHTQLGLILYLQLR